MEGHKQFSEIVKKVNVLVRRYEEGSEDARMIKNLGIPLICQCCGEDYEDEDEENEIVHRLEMVEIVVVVEQKIMVDETTLSNKYIPNPFIVLYCRRCYEGIFKDKMKVEDLPMYQ